MHSSRRLVPLVSFAFFIALAGCGGNTSAPGASSLPAAAGVATGSRTTDASAISAVSDATLEAAVAVEPQAIITAAVPNVAGTYNGSIQGRSQGQLIGRGPAQITVVQNGSQISGNFRFELKEVPGHPVVTRDFTGTVAATPLGAILHVTFMYPDQSSPAGGWAKLEGATLMGKGWQVPDPPDEPYEQLLFWAKAE